MQRESFYLSIALLDRFMSNVKDVHQSRLQLVGVAAVLLSAKVGPPSFDLAEALLEFSWKKYTHRKHMSWP